MLAQCLKFVGTKAVLILIRSSLRQDSTQVLAFNEHMKHSKTASRPWSPCKLQSMENSLLNAVLWHRKVGTSIHLVMEFLQQRLYLAKNIKSFLTEEILIQYFGGLQAPMLLVFLFSQTDVIISPASVFVLCKSISFTQVTSRKLGLHCNPLQGNYRGLQGNPCNENRPLQ